MRVKNVSYVCEYKLKILFSDGKTKIVDLADKIKKGAGVFLALKNLEYFKKVTLDDCHLSICWPNGADICPDVLYQMGEDVSDKKAPFRKKKILRKCRS
jgi:hypothetical protein